MDKFERYLKEQTNDISQLVSEHDGREVTIGGTISQFRELVTKKGDKMAFMTVEDKIAGLEVVVFPKVMEQYKDVLAVDKIVTVRGRINSKNREGDLSEPKVIANEIVELTEAMIKDYEPTWREKRHLKINQKYLPEAVRNKPKKLKKAGAKAVKLLAKSSIPTRTLYLKLSDNYKTSQLEQIRQYCQNNAGVHQVILVIGEESRSAIRLPFRVDGSDDVLDALKQLLGDTAVVLKTKV